MTKFLVKSELVYQYIVLVSELKTLKVAVINEAPQKKTIHVNRVLYFN